MRRLLSGIFILLIWAGLLPADGFVCASIGESAEPFSSPAAAKIAPSFSEGTRHTLVLFAQFRDEEPGWEQIPAWSQDIYDPEKPGSFSHFYDTMSFGKLQVRGEIAQRIYESRQAASIQTQTNGAGSPGLADVPDRDKHLK